MTRIHDLGKKGPGATLRSSPRPVVREATGSIDRFPGPAVEEELDLDAWLLRAERLGHSPRQRPKSQLTAPNTEAVQRQDEVGEGATPLTKPTDEEAAQAARGEEPWWKLKEETRIGQEVHSLYFLGDAGHAELVINPNPTYLSSWLPSLKVEIEKKKDSEASKGYDDLVATTQLLQKAADGKDTKKYPQIHEFLGKIATLLTKISGLLKSPDVTRPPSAVKFESKSDKNGQEYGVTASANPLSVDPGNSPGGSAPVEKSTWGAISTRHPSFVRGHLLNKHLHGPGTANNLTPLTDAVNKDMSAKVEELLKREILEKNEVYEYVVKPEYAIHPATDGYTAKERELIPTQIACTYQKLGLTSGADGTNADAWKAVGKRNDVAIPQELPPVEKEKARGHKRGNQTLASYMQDPNKKPAKSASAEQKRMYKLAIGQKSLKQMFNPMTVSTSTSRSSSSSSSSSSSASLSPASASHSSSSSSSSSSASPSPASARLSSSSASSGELPSAEVLRAIESALETYRGVLSAAADEGMSDQDLHELQIAAYQAATDVYMEDCRAYDVDGEPWDEALTDLLNEETPSGPSSSAASSTASAKASSKAASGSTSSLSSGLSSRATSGKSPSLAGPPAAVTDAMEAVVKSFREELALAKRMAARETYPEASFSALKNVAYLSATTEYISICKAKGLNSEQWDELLEESLGAVEKAEGDFSASASAKDPSASAK